ncbi:NTP transferase domain-containing protein [uncultured Roseibium sp.]|uniref:NTP transferase domain-containing protein n=1 Tax=uncultured Roseibium sp. TaxID=1936171 RepID=UPI002629CCFF|nr:NTP transferase domain-containing protein [uncultured Roseibium sp.]
MQIVIPMSGFGERFRRAGYKLPKPLIEVEGKPIIEHVVDMFPGEEDFVFICNNEHLTNADFGMEALLQRICPTGRVVGIPAHKRGPVHAVQQAMHLLDPSAPVVVNYCDFSCFWDWNHFRKFVRAASCDGAIPAYKGFHPHSLGTTNYAYMREDGGWVSDIREKQPFTDNRMDEFASSGTYYFASAELMRSAFEATVSQDLNINGEYYVSLAYRQLFEDNRQVAVYPLQHFMQWGTPEDVAEYNTWSSAFRDMAVPQQEKPISAGSVVIPMAGLGSRFAREGYTEPKPIIPVSATPMVIQAINDLPAADRTCFVLRSDMPEFHELESELNRTFPSATLAQVAGLTAGQACTAKIGLDALEHAHDSHSGPITFGACDNGALFDAAALQACLDEPEADLLVWGVRGYPNAVRHPEMYGWIDVEGETVRGVSVKKPLDNPKTDPIVLGTFTFRNAEIFNNAYARLLSRDGRVNNEFYLDSMIEDALALGYRCRLFEVDSYLCWGTPNDLKTFEYWQSCFHKWSSHPYRLDLDGRIPRDKLAALATRYAADIPAMPEVAKQCTQSLSVDVARPSVCSTALRRQ